MSKRKQIDYCGDCPHLLSNPRLGTSAHVDDQWCQALPGAFREGIEAFGRWPGAWLGFLPVVSEACPVRAAASTETTRLASRTALKQLELFPVSSSL